MGFDYSGLVAVADALIAKFGKGSVFIRNTPVTSTDPAAGTVTTGTPVDTPVNGVEVAYNEIYQPGATLEKTDKIYALSSLPNIEDELVIDSEYWEIVRIWPKKPGDTFIVCFAQVRR